MTASLKAFFILALISISYAHFDGDCDHDNVEQDIKFADVEEDMRFLQQDGERVLASAPNFRIYPYYEFVKSSAPSSYAAYVENDLFPPVVSYYQAALKAKVPVSGLLKISSSSVCEHSTPSVLKNGVDADFFVYLDTEANSGSQIASTKYCYLASGTKRPLAARIMINRNMLPISTDVIRHEKNMYTIMHEMMHGLGFSTNTYKYFIDSNGKTRSGHIKSVKVDGSTRTFIDVPPLTQKLREHYGCPTLEGALMENGGGSGTSASHFERRVFLYEHMTSGSIYGRRVSELSLGLLEGSGWYEIDYSYAEPFFFGKGQGCSFITGSCTNSNFDEFCSGSNRGCSPTGRGGGSCKSDSISDGCKYYDPSSDYDCDNDNGEDYARLPDLQVYGRGAGSKCFTGTLNSRSSTSLNTFCFKYTCSGSGSDTELTVQVGNKQVPCREEGTQSVDGYYGSINCPDPLTFCNTIGKKYCPRNCMGRGTCDDGKCNCDSGFTGVDCALRN